MRDLSSETSRDLLRVPQPSRGKGRMETSVFTPGSALPAHAEGRVLVFVAAIFKANTNTNRGCIRKKKTRQFRDVLQSWQLSRRLSNGLSLTSLSLFHTTQETKKTSELAASCPEAFSQGPRENTAQRSGEFRYPTVGTTRSVTVERKCSPKPSWAGP